MENIFNVKYNSKLDRLEIPSENGKFKLLKFFKNHKFFSTVLISFFIFSGINFYLIFSFMKMLENIWITKNKLLDNSLEYSRFQESNTSNYYPVTKIK